MSSVYKADEFIDDAPQAQVFPASEFADATNDAPTGGKNSLLDAAVGVAKYGPMGALPEGRNWAGDANDALLNRPGREGAYKSAQVFGKYAIPTALSFMAPEVMPALRGAPLLYNALRLGANGAVQGAAVGAGHLIQSGIQQGVRAAGDESIPAQTPQSALRQAAGAGAGALAGSMLVGGTLDAASSEPAKDFGAGLLRITTNIPEKFGKAVFNDPTILSRGTKAATQKAYEVFENTANLISPRLARALKGSLQESPALASKIVDDATEKLAPYIDQAASRAQGKVVYDTQRIAADINSGALGKDVHQTIYDASQAAAHLKKLGKMGKPEEAANAANINNAKDAFDQVLELVTPGYKNARNASFEEATNDAFNSFWPLNNNQSPNALRGYAGVQTAIASPFIAAATHSPYPLAGLSTPFLQSPLVAKGVIKGVSALSRAGAGEALRNGGTVLLAGQVGQAAK